MHIHNYSVSRCSEKLGENCKKRLSVSNLMMQVDKFVNVSMQLNAMN